MFKMMPQGVKDWGATVSIPMITQGQAIKAKYKTKVKVEDGPLALFSCLQGGEDVKVIPKTVKDYATILLETLGVVQKEPQTAEAKASKDELVTALSVGFINFIKTQLSRFFPGIKCFNDAGAAAPSETSLIGFATNPQTFVSLFSMVNDGNRKVDNQLYSVFKTEFGKKEGIENIDQYFVNEQGQPLESITYAQFVQSYARLGAKLLADKKWPGTMPGMSDADRETLMESSAQVLQKYGIPDDTSGTLATGLAAACMHGSDLVSGLMKGPKPGETPAPAAPATAKPPGTP
jgi:hypothetical protein